MCLNDLSFLYLHFFVISRNLSQNIARRVIHINILNAELDYH